MSYAYCGSDLIVLLRNQNNHFLNWILHGAQIKTWCEPPFHQAQRWPS